MTSMPFKVIKLEKKSKVGQFINKESLQISRDQAEKIVNYDFSFLKGIKNKLATEFYLDLSFRIPPIINIKCISINKT